TTFSLLLIVGSVAIISQADVSKPGDKLHVVDELGERIILTLPLSEAQKIDYQTKIVDERTNELDYLLEVTSENTVKKQAIKQSQESLDRAIEQARNAKEKSSTKGDRTKSERYDKVLKQLDTLAEEQEMKIKYWRDKEKNEEIKREYDRNLELLKKSRNRAQSKDNSGSDEDHE
ncbi:MAG TPA: hypothetical protein VEC17_01750, partial [Candidatus Binatia bacterium]|nr:hypothetical protein [Candidatus Binatia bacterium]